MPILLPAQGLAARVAPQGAKLHTWRNRARDACEASNYPWEKPEAASKGHRGLTQIEFDVANMRVTGVVDKGTAKILLSVPARLFGMPGSARPSSIRSDHENLHPRRLSRHRPHAQSLRQADRPRGQDLERSRPGGRCARRTPEGHRGAGADTRAHQDPRRAARAPTQAQAHQPAKRLSAHRRRRSEEHTSELQSQSNLVCRLLL